MRIKPLALHLALSLLVALAAAGCASTGSAAPPKRAVPDYDGRGPAPTSTSDVALWVPRAALFPLWAVAEYGLRRPTAWAFTTVEEKRFVPKLLEAFTSGADDDFRTGFVPIVALDFGGGSPLSRYGAYVWADDFLVPGNNLTARATLAGFIDSYDLALTDTYWPGNGTSFDATARWWYRPDRIFAGLGPRSREEDLSRFGEHRLSGELGVREVLAGRSFVRGSVELARLSFQSTTCCEEPSLRAQSETGAFPIPYGFDEGYTALSPRFSVVLDSRQARPAAGSGVRAEAYGSVSFDLSAAPVEPWARYGAAVVGMLDVYRERVLSLALSADFADPLGDTPVPFTELITLGGNERLFGFPSRRLVGRSAAVAMLKYQWPIWTWLDASLHGAVGNVFGAHLEDFELGLLRASFGFGFETPDMQSPSFAVLFAWGTEPFEDGGAIENFRLTLGSSFAF